MEAYLDNAATTKPFETVREVMIETLTKNFGNPSSMHRKGIEAEQYVKRTREIIARSLKAQPKEIIFTSGGTESNNMALIGAALANKRAGKHIISTKIEHASVHNPLIYLEQKGFRVTYLSVDKNGLINLDELLDALCDETILVSIMYVNNEIGAREKIEKISTFIKKYNEKIVFHVDAIQAFGKYKIYPERMGVDLLSVSAHKIHGPKGVGFLYIRKKTKVAPLILGGGQQFDMRSGTENVPGIAGMGTAVKEMYLEHTKKIEYLYSLKQTFINLVLQIDGTYINGMTGMDICDTAPHIVSVSFEGIRAEVLLHALEDKKIYVSSGSACSSNHPALSGTLKSIGVAHTLLDSTIRFSFSVTTTLEEIHYTVEMLHDIIPMLRRFIRK